MRDHERGTHLSMRELGPRPMCTYEEAIAAAARVLADARARIATLTAEEVAREAYVPGGPSVEELAEKVRRLRAETALHAEGGCEDSA